MNEFEGAGFGVVGEAGMRAEARRKAVGAARDKAALYAGRAGARLGPAVRVDDIDPRDARAERHRGRGG